MAHGIRHLIRLAVWLGLLAPALVTAQDGGASAAPAFTVYAIGDSPEWKNLFYQDGQKEPVKLVFRANGRSSPVRVTSTAKPLTFVRERIDPQTQKKTYASAAEARWPEGKTAKALLVFAIAPGQPEETAVRVLALDDGVEAFPLRTARIFNATGRTLLVKVGAYEGNALPGVSDPQPYPVKREDPLQVGSFPLAFALNDPATGPRLLHSGQAEAWPLGRLMVVVLPPKDPEGAVQVRLLVDAPPVPKK